MRRHQADAGRRVTLEMLTIASLALADFLPTTPRSTTASSREPPGVDVAAARSGTTAIAPATPRRSHEAVRVARGRESMASGSPFPGAGERFVSRAVSSRP